MTKTEMEFHAECAADRKRRRRAQRFWMFILNIFFMAVVGFILYAKLDSSPSETAMFMSFGSIISLNMAYLFGEIWEDMNITKTGIKASS